MYEIVIRPSESGRRLSSILMKTHHFSRRIIRRVLSDGTFYCNGVPVMLSQVMEAGDVVSFTMPEETSSVEPEPMSIDICYEDDLVVVVNKRAGILTHPSAREKSGSLLAGVAAHLAPVGLTPHSVHRLDKYTSGAILFAKHTHAHHLLDIALRNQMVHRAYVAIVFLPGDEPLGTWLRFEDEIAQDPTKPSRRVITESETGQVAITHMNIVAKIGDVGVCVFRLETGRTHQIRLQMASRGMPLVGDRDYTIDYAKAADSAVIRRARYYEKVLSHQALHAYQLSFQVPGETSGHDVYAPPSEELEELWSLLGGDMTLLEMTKSRFQSFLSQ